MRKSLLLIIIIWLVFCSFEKNSKTALLSDSGLNEESKIFMNVVLGETTVDQVKEIFGKTEFFQTGDAADSFHSVNYITNDKNCLQTISFWGGEIDGDSVSGVSVTDYANRKTNKGKLYSTTIRCKDIHSRSGLRIGMTKKEVKNIFGKPTDIEGNEWTYEVGFIDVYIQPSDPDYKKYCDLLKTDKPSFALLYRFTMGFVNDKVVKFSIYRTEQQ
jgi:hypothetical protein